MIPPIVRALLVLVALGMSACASDGPQVAVPVEPEALSPADEVAIFQAAGFRLEGAEWRHCDIVDERDIYTPGEIEQVGDLNDDGLPEVVVTEHSLICYGNLGTIYTLVSGRPDGSWSGMIGGLGIPGFLETGGVDGWPDIELGGPGFCFPVLRWNGDKYALHRHEYGGEPCERR